jgi:peptidoglycan hydrolase-like protein with peptidoglycan-binding domain
MARSIIALLALTMLPAIASAQTDTTRRRDTTRAPQPQDSARRVTSEARGQLAPTGFGARFRADLPNYGFSSDQAIELQRALTRTGCDVGTADGVVGQRTLRGIECFHRQQSLASTDLESVLTALNLSFARPAEPVAAPATSPTVPRRDTTVLPPVIRQDSMNRPDVRARRDSAQRRDSVRRDSVRRDSLRRDTTVRRDTTAGRPDQE